MHAAPKYRHYKPKNLAVVRIDGRDHYLGPYNSPESWEKYGRLLAERRSAGVAPSPARQAEPADLTVAELILAYCRHAVAITAVPTVPRARVGKHPTRPPAVEATLRRHARAGLRPQGAQGRPPAPVDSGLGRRTVNQRTARIVRAFRFAVENEMVPPRHQALKAVEGLKRGRSGAKESKTVKPVPYEHVAAVKPFLSRQLRAVVEVGWFTGMRSGEVLQCVRATWI